MIEEEIEQIFGSKKKELVVVDLTANECDEGRKSSVDFQLELSAGDLGILENTVEGADEDLLQEIYELEAEESKHRTYSPYY